MTDITITTAQGGNNLAIDVARGTDLTLDVSIGNEITLTVDKGIQGQAATVAVGTTTTLSAGSSATVNNSGTSSDAILNFGIPQGVGVSTGGTTGQVLTKVSSTDYDTTWTTNGAGTVTSVSATAGTGISVTGSPITSSGTLNITNTAPDQTVVLTAGTGISTGGTYPSFTVTNSAPDRTVAIASGTGISATGTYPNFTVANTAPDQTVALTAGTGIGVTGTYPNFTLTNTAPSSGGTVTSVIGTAPIVSSGGNTPAISMAKATTSVDGYLSATDWTTFNNKSNTTGTVTSVSATVPSFLSVSGSPITTSGTLALTYSGTALPVANGGTGVTTSTGSGSNVLNTSPTLTTPAITGGTISNLTQELIGQSTDQGTGVLQVTGQSTFNGAVTDKSLNLQGGNNLIKYSQDLSQTGSWLQFLSGSGTVSRTANYGVAPDGTTTSTRLVLSAPSGSVAEVYQRVTVTAGLNFACGVWVKSNSGTPVVGLFYKGLNYATPVTLTTSWVFYPYTAASEGSAGPGIDIILAPAALSTSASADIQVWGAQLELGTVAAAYTPTTTAAITTTNNISVPSGQVLVQTGSISTPSIGFSNFASNQAGIYSSSNNILDIVASGATQARFSNNGNFFTGPQISLTSTSSLNWSSGVAGASSGDTFLYRDAANTLAQRNSTNAQTFRLYNTYTSSTSYETLQFDWTTTANTATISTQKGSGGGTLRTLAIGQPLVISPGYTVATLPTGVVGMRAYVTNALAPSYGVAVTGGGAVTIPVFYNGTAWICA